MCNESVRAQRDVFAMCTVWSVDLCMCTAQRPMSTFSLSVLENYICQFLETPFNRCAAVFLISFVTVWCTIHLHIPVINLKHSLYKHTEPNLTSFSSVYFVFG